MLNPGTLQQFSFEEILVSYSQTVKHTLAGSMLVPATMFFDDDVYFHASALM